VTELSVCLLLCGSRPPPPPPAPLVLACVLQVWARSARHMLDVVDTAFRYSAGTF
jgi:hypothetical protein